MVYYASDATLSISKLLSGTVNVVLGMIITHVRDIWIVNIPNILVDHFPWTTIGKRKVSDMGSRSRLRSYCFLSWNRGLFLLLRHLCSYWVWRVRVVFFVLICLTCSLSSSLRLSSFVPRGLRTLSRTAFFHLFVRFLKSVSLLYSLSSLRRSGEGRCTHFSFTFVSFGTPGRLRPFAPFRFISYWMLIDSFVGIISSIILFHVILTSANSWGLLDGLMDLPWRSFSLRSSIPSGQLPQSRISPSC